MERVTPFRVAGLAYNSLHPMNNPRQSTWLNFSVEHPWLALLLSLILVVAATAGASRLTFSDDIRVFFDPDNPQLKAYELHEDTYSKGNSVLFVVAPKDGNVFGRETLTSLETLTSEAWKLPYSRRVDSIVNFQHTYARDDDLVVENLVRDAGTLSDADLSRIRAVALAEPLLVNRLVSGKAHVAAVNVPVVLPGVEPLVEQPELVAAARKLAADIEAANPNLTIHLTGLVMINNALAEAGRHDMETLIPLMLLVILVVLALLLRNVSGVFATLLVILFSITAGVGCAGWFGIQLSPPVVSAANIIMTLAVADSVHVLITFLHGMRDGHSKARAMKESLRINAMPVFLTSISTAIGFMSMNFSESPPFRDLGNIVAGGVVFAFLLSLLMLPALMMLLPVHAKQTQDGEQSGMSVLSSFVIRQRSPLLIGMSALAIILVLFVSRNELNDEFVQYFDESLAFRQATDFTIDNLTGFEFIEYSLQSGEGGGINDPDYLRTVSAFADWYRQQPEVMHVYAFTDIMKRLNKNLHDDDPAWFRLPDSRELAAQYLLLYEMSLPFGLDMTDQIDLDKSATRFKVSLTGISTNGMLELEARAEQWLADNAPGVMRATGTGQSLMFAHIGSANIISMLSGTVLAMVLISCLLMIALRSFKFGLLSLIPNLAPAAMAFGLWGLLVGEVGLALSIVVGMTMGIVVDDTVHFMSKYLYARRQHGHTPEQAVRYTFNHVGSALWVTSLVLIAGFSVLMFSDFQLNSGMGLLSAVTIAMALIADFFLLPPLLMLVERNADVEPARSEA